MIIGFTGKMGCGKSTAINLLSKYTKLDLKLVKFAQPLYDMQELIYDRIKPVFERNSDFKKDRKLLQWLGTDWGRDTISKSLWIDLWKASAGVAIHDMYDVICDDVRFDNEAETLRSLGGIVVEITSENAGNRIDTKAGLTNHTSESGIARNLVDYSIANNGTIEEFKRALLDVLNKQENR